MIRYAFQLGYNLALQDAGISKTSHLEDKETEPQTAADYLAAILQKEPDVEEFIDQGIKKKKPDFDNYPGVSGNIRQAFAQSQYTTQYDGYY